MKRKQLVGMGVVAIVACLSSAAMAGPLGTAITYHGDLKYQGNNYSGTADFQFGLWDALTGGSQKGISPQPALNVPVANGLFIVYPDFGSGAFNGDARWLEIAVRSPAGSGSYQPLSPRQPINATPYALYALSGPGSGGPWAVSGNNIYNTNTGNVGIGTTSLSRKLNVAGGVGVDDGNANTGTTTNALTFGASDSGEGIGSNRSSGANQYGLDFYTFFTKRMSITSGGNVGIGTNPPSRTLGIDSGSIWPARFQGEDITASAVEFSNFSPFGTKTWEFGVAGLSPVFGMIWGDMYLNYQGNNSPGLVITQTNNIGIGTSRPGCKLHVNKLGNDVGVFVGDRPPFGTAQYETNLTTTSTQTYTHAWFAENDQRVFSVEAGGRTTVCSLIITGGCDLTESFNVQGNKPEPGDVVVIDADHPGELKLSTSAYDAKVAGVISGAGGVNPGLSLGQSGSIASGDHQVALTGRIYCKCDASFGAIVPGDMLTSSVTPGHAMKATNRERAFGAVIGKAMTGLEKGKGLVLILVTLQ